MTTTWPRCASPASGTRRPSGRPRTPKARHPVRTSHPIPLPGSMRLISIRCATHPEARSVHCSRRDQYLARWPRAAYGPPRLGSQLRRTSMSLRQSFSPGRAGAGTLDDSFEQHEASAPLGRSRPGTLAFSCLLVRHGIPYRSHADPTEHFVHRLFQAFEHNSL